MSERDMNATDLLDMHLSYGPGGNHHVDAEVWRRWPHLEGIYGRHMARLSEFADRRLAERGFDLLDMEPMPGQMEARAEYMREYTTAVEAIKEQTR